MRDVIGVRRGYCKECEKGECPEFIQNTPDCTEKVSNFSCAYCGHLPLKHARCTSPNRDSDNSRPVVTLDFKNGMRNSLVVPKCTPATTTEEYNSSLTSEPESVQSSSAKNIFRKILNTSSSAAMAKNPQVLLESQCSGYFSFLNKYESLNWETRSPVEVSNDEQLLNSVEKFSQEFFKADCNLEPKSEFGIKVSNLLRNYKKKMADFSTMFKKWLERRNRIICNLQKIVQKDRIFQATSKMTLFSLSLDFFAGWSQPIFKFNSNYLLLIYAVSGVSVISSLTAVLCSEYWMSPIVSGIERELIYFGELEREFYRGYQYDQEIQKLFPCGIDLELVRKIAFDSNLNLAESWREKILTAVIFTNAKKNRNVLSDVNFLTSAKVFAESSVAEIWTDRMKLRHLLDDLAEKLLNLPSIEWIFTDGVFQ